MADYTLTRESPLQPDCTLGVFRDPDGNALCVTLELPWLDNQHNVSCIPTGKYRVTKFDSPSKGRVFLVHGVPDRDMVEMHVANTVRDLLGCIGVGLTYGVLQGRRAITQSKATLTRLLKDLPDEFWMEIL